MEKTLKVEGIRCAMCVKTIERALLKLDGVEEACVNITNGTVRVRYNPGRVSLRKIQEAIEGSGYRVGGIGEEIKVSMKIGGMSCAMCAKTVESALIRLEGVKKASVNLVDSSVTVVMDESVRLEDLRKAVEESGYRYLGIKSERQQDESDSMKRKLMVGLSASLIILVLIYGAKNFPQSVLLQFFVATLALAYAGRDMFFSAVRSLRHKTLNMGVMYSMGIGSAYSASILALAGLLSKEFVFFETSTLLLTFLLMGKMLEAKARSKTGEAIRKLTALQVKDAVVLRDGKELRIGVENLIPGGVLVVRSGERIPVDGVVIDGESYVDESMITGEPIPNLKKPGARVTGGTISKGYLKVRVTKVERDTYLSQIIRMVEEAITSKPPIQRLADRIVTYFIPLVLTIAISSFIYWYFIASAPLLFAFTTLVAVLVIACPCAFGLATPTAVTVGMGKGAERGILIKSGSALEVARKVTTVVFDKTGTLTEGKLKVTRILSLNGKDGESELEILKLAAVAERGSGHPIAEAIVEKAEEKGIAIGEPEKVEVIAGRGIVAFFEGNEIVVGNKEFVKELIGETGFKIEAVERMIKEVKAEAKTAIIVAKNKELIGIIVVSDSVKEEAKKAVKELHRMGKRVVMITGDGKHSAEAVARKIGIDTVLAEVMPDEKAKEVKNFRRGARSSRLWGTE